MKIHEFQGKKILDKFDVPIQDGYIIQDISKAEEIIKKVQNDFNTTDVIVKAQIHAGGRGKGGGVKYSPDFKTALENVNNILGMNLVTPQTGSKGKKVNTVYVTKSFNIKNEYYAAITLDRSKKTDVFMASTEGGIDIESVAKETPEKIIKVWIKPDSYLTDENASIIAKGLNFKGKLFDSAIDIFKNMYRCYKNMDCSILEINPLITTKSDEIIAVDAKLNFDNNALYRHPEILKMQDETESDPMELKASKYNLNDIKLNGNVGCMVNGAGLAMATMDIIKICGGEPANFLDVGGTANPESIKNGFKIILYDNNVKAILINIFGGIVRCDRVAKGVVKAINNLGLKVPVVVRLEGTNADIAKDILIKSNVEIIPASDLKDAAKKVVHAALKEEV